ncbi:hypothetical protein CJF31_00003166 [Rutstroemia sp. NJR-2017a BVV2]|nr:hypothetical protein CJF31_00001958 [Rutstroemia sp. NJR-2017a BVV2]PQE18505.1 hypothetical protein CJF31_00003166 [Rutstroemia sp. NJR-2017a BVV2]
MNIQGGYYGNALQAAAADGDQAIAKLLLDRGADINAQGGYCGNALQAAAVYENQGIAKLLLDRGADVNAQGGEYSNALQAAAAAAADGNQAIAKLLLDRGADVNAQGGYCGNALQVAAWHGNQATAKLLLDRGADINAQGGEYGNALQAAAADGDQAIAKLLLDYGADINAQGGYFGNALQAAAAHENQVIAKLLLDYRADINAQGGYYGNALQAAVWHGNQVIAKLLLDYGADINAQGGYYGNALQAAAADGDQAIAKLLLDCGADINTQGGYYGNALQAAAVYENQAIAKLLLDHGADVNAQGGEYGNALQAAAWHGKQEIVRLLLDYGADITIQPRSTNRLSVLHVCVASGNTAALKLLLDAGGKIHLDTQDESGQTPLHLAVEKRDILAAKRLLESGGSTDISDLSDNTPFQLAIQSGFSQMALLLFSKAKYNTSSLSATDWRCCLARGLACHIEMINSEPPEVLVWDNTLKMKMELNDLSYPLSSYSDKLPARETDFMSRKNYAKRIFSILVDGSLLHDGLEFDLRCRWWRKVPQESKYQDMSQSFRPLSKSWSWTIQMRSPPSIDTVRRTPASTCFLECGLFVTCIFLPAIEEWPETFNHLDKFAGDHKQRHGILWIMVKPEAHEAKSNSTKLFLCSKFSFSTSEFAGVPVTAIDLFLPLIQRIQSIWDHNFDVFETRLLSTRSMVLKSGGNDQNLVQELLKDAQLLELLIANLKKQSLFGMNVDVLENNPAWWWYIPLAALLMFITFTVWIIFKRSEGLEDNLEQRFDRLFRFKRPFRQNKEDVERGLGRSEQIKRTRTAAYPASGKKRS